VWDAAFIFIDESLARFVARTRVGELVVRAWMRERRKARAWAETGGVRAYQIIIGSVLLQVTRRLCCGGSNPNKARQIQYVVQAGLCSKRSINQREDWQRIEFEVLRLDRGHAFLSLVPNSAEMRYIPFSALQPVPAEQQHAQSIALMAVLSN